MAQLKIWESIYPAYIEKPREMHIGDDCCGRYTQSYHITEAVIHTGHLSERLIKIFKDCMNENKQFRDELFLYYYLQQQFLKNGYVIKFITKVSDTNSGIFEMKTNRLNLDIEVFCDNQFFIMFMNKDQELLSTFSKLIEHELVHVGQAIQMNLIKLSLVVQDTIEKKREADLKNKPIPKKIVSEYNYLSNPREIMAYAQMALTELKLSGLSKEQILHGIKTLFKDYKNEESAISTTIENYNSYFNIKIEKDRIVLKRFYKQMYQYLTDQGKSLIRTTR